jgi:hypothetical protein
VSSFPKAAIVAAGALVAALVVPVALAHSTFRYGPDLRVEGQTKTGDVAFTFTLTPSYSSPKPGVRVTLSNCKTGKQAPIRVLRRIGPLGAGQTLSGRRGKYVWSVPTVPAKPVQPKLRLRMALPAVGAKFCLLTSMYDSYTKQTVNQTTRVPL